MIKLRKLFTLLFLLPAAAFAQGAVSFQVVKPTDTLTITTPFTLELDITHPQGYKVSLSTVTPEGSAFDIRSAVLTPDASGQKHTALLTVVPYTVGMSTFPALAWTFDDGRGSVSTDTMSPELPLEVKPSADFDPNSEISDIRPPYAPFPYWPFVLAVLIIAAVYAASRWSRRARPSALAARGKDSRTPSQRALDQLDVLEKSDIWYISGPKDFYSALAIIARQYLAGRYGMDAMQMTTSDISRAMKKTGIETIVSARMKSLLSSADMVKFAKVEPEEDRRDDDVKLLRQFIAETEPPAPVIAEGKK